MCKIEDRAQLTDALTAARFAFGSVTGSAIFTVVSPRTGARFTYKVKAKTETDARGEQVQTGLFFVNVLVGPTNTSDYQYLGVIKTARDGSRTFSVTRNSRIASDAPSAVAMEFVTHRLSLVERGMSNVLPVEFWHEGSCARCGRRLTVPASIASGFGPVCINLV